MSLLRDDPPTWLRCIAMHEAGHVLVAWRRRLSPPGVVVRSDEGYCEPEGAAIPAGLSRQSSRWCLASRALIALAGPTAQAQHIYLETGLRVKGWGARCGGAADHPAAFEDVQALKEGRHEGVMPLLDRLKLWAYRELTEEIHWAGVVRLARDLELRGRLTRNDINALLTEVGIRRVPIPDLVVAELHGNLDPP